jgi:hypothetical protein
MRRLTSAICLLTLFALTARGGDIAVSPDPFAVSVQREPISTQEPMFRAFLTSGESKFTFVIPEKYGASGDPSHGRLQLKTLQGDGNITLAFVGTAASERQVLPSGPYREFLLERYPNGKIVKEFTRPVANGAGTIFDVEWRSANGFAQKTRAVYFPTSAGVIELTATAGARKFKDAQAALTSILGTFTASVNGQLVFHRLGGAN